MSGVEDVTHGIFGVVGGIFKAIPEALYAFIFWFILQVVLDAIYLSLAALIDFLFLVLTVIGILQGADDIFEAPRIALAVLAFFSLLFNLFLIASIH